MSWRIFGVVTAVFCIIAAGLRCRIRVSPDSVEFIRSLYFIPYYICRGRVITGVTYDGDWDDEDQSSGVVVTIDSKEVHIGSHKRKTELYLGLYRVSAGFCRNKGI